MNMLKWKNIKSHSKKQIYKEKPDRNFRTENVILNFKKTKNLL